MIDHAKEIQELDKQIDCLDNELFDVTAQLSHAEEYNSASSGWLENIIKFIFYWIGISHISVFAAVIVCSYLPMLNSLDFIEKCIAGIIVAFFGAGYVVLKDHIDEKRAFVTLNRDAQRLTNEQSRLEEAIANLQHQKQSHQAQLKALAKERGGQLSLSDPTTPAGALTETDHTE